MAKRKPRQTARNKADAVFSEYIRARDGRCYTCGTTDSLQCGHLITRSKLSVRWDERNAKAQYKGCNFLHENQPEHFTARYIEEYGEAAYLELVLKSNTPVKYTTADIEQIAIAYRVKLDELRGEKGDR